MKYNIILVGFLLFLSSCGIKWSSVNYSKEDIRSADAELYEVFSGSHEEINFVPGPQDPVAEEIPTVKEEEQKPAGWLW